MQPSVAQNSIYGVLARLPVVVVVVVVGRCYVRNVGQIAGAVFHAPFALLADEIAVRFASAVETLAQRPQTHRRIGKSAGEMTLGRIDAGRCEPVPDEG